ncbi:hypothetical protein GJ744_008268 [Endocarpon pusillum]|uniref:Uncharacterized protein n=1 Tax=Endocarpon pusillum TaxID=364733 RepID=A0A8H7AHH2_9EURO|nr:hypothetical protein GJ744_008268 [Endocarpon pusillum]
MGVFTLSRRVRPIICIALNVKLKLTIISNLLSVVDKFPNPGLTHTPVAAEYSSRNCQTPLPSAEALGAGLDQVQQTPTQDAMLRDGFKSNPTDADGPLFVKVIMMNDLSMDDFRALAQLKPNGRHARSGIKQPNC